MKRADALILQLAPGINLDERIGPYPQLPADKNDAKAKRGEQMSAATGTTVPPPTTSMPASSSALAFPNAGQDQKPLASGGNGSYAAADDDEEYDEVEYDSDGDDMAFVGGGLQQLSLGDHVRPQSNINLVLTANADVIQEGKSQVKMSPLSQRASVSEQSGSQGTNRPSQFIGKASDFHMLPILQRLKADGSLDVGGARTRLRSQFWRTQDYLDFLPNKIEELDLHWPEPDLEAKLYDAYFARCNHEYPIVSEIMWRREIAKPGWRHDRDLVRLALSIFAVGSKHVDDPRVTNEQETGEYEAAGFKWHSAQVTLGMDFTQFAVPMPRIQSLLLSVIYMFGTPLTSTSAWALLAVAIRLLQDVGAHRKATARKLGYSLVTDETYRRMWWTAYVLDRLLSATLGRPTCIQDEDFDVDLPTLVDDVHLVSASDADRPTAQQPAERPALISGFVYGLKLFQILGRTLRTVYAISKSRVSRGFVGSAWDGYIVAEIDSSLNQWLSQVPPHLRYGNSEVQDEEWLIQSSNLFLIYYYTQVLVHRPFIPKPTSKSSMKFPSLAITSNAARSAIHILYNLRSRGLIFESGISTIWNTFSFGLVLLLVIWAAKRNGARVTVAAMTDVRKCVEVLETLEQRWNLAGRLHDVLSGIIETSELPVMSVDPPAGKSLKRAAENRDTGNSHQQTGSTSDRVLGNAVDIDERVDRPKKGQPSRRTLPFSTTELVAPFDYHSGSSVSQESPDSVWSETRDSPSHGNEQSQGDASRHRDDGLTEGQRVYSDYIRKQQAAQAAHAAQLWNNSNPTGTQSGPQQQPVFTTPGGSMLGRQAMPLGGDVFNTSATSAQGDASGPEGDILSSLIASAWDMGADAPSISAADGQRLTPAMGAQSSAMEGYGQPYPYFSGNTPRAIPSSLDMMPGMSTMSPATALDQGAAGQGISGSGNNHNDGISRSNSDNNRSNSRDGAPQDPFETFFNQNFWGDSDLMATLTGAGNMQQW